MVKPFDPSKFRKSLTKGIPGVSEGFRDPKIWISTGNYTLNYLISGDFYKGIPLGKVTVFAGESGSGKSFICSGNIVRDAQAQGVFVVLCDSENSLDQQWLEAVGVDTSPEKLLKLNVSMVDDVAKTISEFMKNYKAEYGDTGSEDAPPVLFVIDSLGMLLTPVDTSQFDAGNLKGDMGRKAKALTALVRNTVNLIAPYDVGVVCTNHTYQSQDMFDPDDKISGGCLTSGHKVLLHNQEYKDISDIVAGDIVATLNGPREVEETFNFNDKEVFELELSDGSVIQATAEHKFMVSSEDNIYKWKTVKELLPEDTILKWTK